jgi:hypothetical protein
MIENLFIVFLIASLIVIITIFWKKIPILTQLPEKKSRSWKQVFGQVKKRIKNIPFFKNFSWNGILLKALSKIRILVLKIENKIGCCLHNLRKKSQKQKK